MTVLLVLGSCSHFMVPYILMLFIVFCALLFCIIGTWSILLHCLRDFLESTLKNKNIFVHFSIVYNDTVISK